MENKNPKKSNVDLENLNLQIEQLKKVIEESYYKIPKEEFETVTRQSIKTRSSG